MKVTINDNNATEFHRGPPELCLAPENDRDREVMRELAERFWCTGAGFFDDGRPSHVEVPLLLQGRELHKNKEPAPAGE